MDDRPGADLVRSWKDPDYREAGTAHPSGDIFMDEFGGNQPDTTTLATSLPCLAFLTFITSQLSCGVTCQNTLFSGQCPFGTAGVCPA